MHFDMAIYGDSGKQMIKVQKFGLIWVTPSPFVGTDFYQFSIFSPFFFLIANCCLQEIEDVWVILLGLGLVLTASLIGILIFIFRHR